VVALNAAAARLLGRPRAAVAGLPVSAVFGPAPAERLQQALAELDEADEAVALSLDFPNGGALPARLTLLESDADVALLRVPSSAAAAAGEPAAAEDDGFDSPSPSTALPVLPAAVLAAESPVDSETFRRDLVELMLCTIEAWERSGGRTRIDLAERSRIWRVTRDDGRLRVRAMERYLNLAKLPRRPRWREVVRTAYFVLAECRLDAADRDALRRRAESIQARVRQRALV
ncbi:hypothetical protein, partial [Tahibacter caeni]|uniref:hypothetical protein n=1 Tax=Tahibacter caeni TaxID=1453545 RepID=UPI0021479DC5